MNFSRTNFTLSPVAICLLAVIASSLAAFAASPQIDSRPVKSSEPRAVSLVEAAQKAHGKAAFARVRDIAVHYHGRWAFLAPRIQPVLSDTRFRQGSEERLRLNPRLLVQEHSGPGGKKTVVRTPGKVTVSYNGTVSQDAEARRAAALVADAYTMFLLGPFYFDRPGVHLAMAGEGMVDNAVCDQVLAVLRPGFGFSPEDRVILSIDRASKQLRRVRMTLNGLESTRGAEVDVTFRDLRRINGVLWPTDFDERIRVPFDLPAHHWQTIDLTTNRGLRAADLKIAR